MSEEKQVDRYNGIEKDPLGAYVLYGDYQHLLETLRKVLVKHSSKMGCTCPACCVAWDLIGKDVDAKEAAEKDKRCGEKATHRYTWPGKDEALACGKHAAEISGVALAMGSHLQIILLSEQDREQGLLCHSFVGEKT